MKKILITLLFLCFSHTSLAAPKVIIIGSGISGLSAAQFLIKHDVSVSVLEARNRIGGRIQTIYPWGNALDLGAAWIHGVTQNPITTLAKSLSIPTSVTAYNDNKLLEKFKSFKIYDAHAQPISKITLQKALSLAEKFEDYVEENEILLTHNSIEDALTKFIIAHPMNPQTELVLRYILNNVFLYEFGEDLSALSANANSPYQRSLVSGPNVLFPYGYSQLLPSLMANVSVHLNQTVTKIIYNNSGVDVYTKDKKYHADYVIITVPLGVLKSNSITFIPELPKAKQNAIRNLSMATYEKIFLFFDKPFWDKEIEWIGYLPHKKDMRKIPDIMNLYKFTRSPILLAFTAGSFGKEVNLWSDEKTINYIMQILKKIYGENIPEPSSYVITRWSKDPYSYGAYSYLPVGVNKNNFKMLAEPVMHKLFFAGEATSETDPGTVHGAYLTGQRAAREILLNLN